MVKGDMVVCLESHGSDTNSYMIVTRYRCARDEDGSNS